MEPGTRIAIKVMPKASAERVGEMRKLADGSEALVVYVTAPADKGKANEAMLRLLAAHLDVAPSRLSILRGHTSRNKLVAVN